MKNILTSFLPVASVSCSLSLAHQGYDGESSALFSNRALGRQSLCLGNKCPADKQTQQQRTGQGALGLQVSPRKTLKFTISAFLECPVGAGRDCPAFTLGQVCCRSSHPCPRPRPHLKQFQARKKCHGTTQTWADNSSTLTS